MIIRKKRGTATKRADEKEIRRSERLTLNIKI